MVHAVWPGAHTVAQLSLIGSCQGQAIVNVFHFQAPTANESAFTNDADRITWSAGLITDWRTNVVTSYRAMHPNDYSLNEYRAQVLEVPGQFEHRLSAVSDTTGLPALGTIASGADDLTTAVVIKWRTNVASRRTRGRSYIGPLEQADSASGKLVGGGALDTAITSFLTAMARYIGAGAGVTAGFQHVVYSRPYSAPHGAYTRRIGGVLTVVNSATDYAGGAELVTSAVRDVNLRAQRRREIGVGS